jgi:hypothetical protein
MGNCCVPDELLLPNPEGKSALRTHTKYTPVSESALSAHGINKSHQVATSKYERDSVSSAHPVNIISFVQEVRPPSLIETPEQMDQLNDSQKMSQLYSSNLKIKNSTIVKWSDYSVRAKSVADRISEL